MTGNMYSLAKSSIASAVTRGQPNSTVPAMGSTTSPSILVWPDIQNVAAIDTRPIRAIAPWGMRSSRATTRCQVAATGG